MLNALCYSLLLYINAFVGKSLGPRLFQMLQSLLYFSPYAFALQLSFTIVLHVLLFALFGEDPS